MRDVIFNLLRNRGAIAAVRYFSLSALARYISPSPSSQYFADLHQCCQVYLGNLLVLVVPTLEKPDSSELT